MLKSDLMHAKAITTMIFTLTQDEGDSVEICHPNPEFGGPNSTIVVIKEFAPPIQYYGDGIYDCLQKAIAAEVS